jgi:Fur family transcriptional regulator, ferric uptake regulator
VARHSPLAIPIRTRFFPFLRVHPTLVRVSPLVTTKPKSPNLNHLVESVVARLRARKMRRTAALDALIREMARSPRPTTIAELSASPLLAQRCDPTTVYRLLMKLESHGIVRRLGLHERATYFILVSADHHHDYLVCTVCGMIIEVDFACPVRSLEKKLGETSGFHHIYHELEFFGVCPTCHDGREHQGTAHCC